MKSKYHMSAAEKEVMEALWDQTEPVKQSQLLLVLQERGKEWKRQTLNTFLSRLEVKGLVIREKRRVSPSYSRADYNDLQTEELIRLMYDGKIANFVEAFLRSNKATNQDIEEALAVLEECAQKGQGTDHA